MKTERKRKILLRGRRFIIERSVRARMFECSDKVEGYANGCIVIGRISPSGLASEQMSDDVYSTMSFLVHTNVLTYLYLLFLSFLYSFDGTR